MYHPRADFTTRDDAGGIHATTKGNTIYAAPNGELTISSRRTGEPVFRREGAGPRPDTGQAAQAPRVEGPSAEAPSKSRKTGPGRRAAKRLEALYQRDDDPGQGKGPARRPQKPPAPRKPDGPSV
jgi:hypothetical protein